MNLVEPPPRPAPRRSPACAREEFHVTSHNLVAHVHTNIYKSGLTSVGIGLCCLVRIRYSPANDASSRKAVTRVRIPAEAFCSLIAQCPNPICAAGIRTCSHSLGSFRNSKSFSQARMILSNPGRGVERSEKPLSGSERGQRPSEVAWQRRQPSKGLSRAKNEVKDQVKLPGRGVSLAKDSVGSRTMPKTE
jgi:hypothetical protein